MRRVKKAWALLLCLCTAISLMPTPALAAGIPEDWDGTVDTSWYDPGSPNQSYEIASAAQLAGLAELVNEGNDFSGTTFTLTTDINLNDKEWTPIGKGYMDWGTGETSLGFSGTFDGGMHTVQGLCVTVNSAASNDGYILGGAALFGYLLTGTVKNLTVKGNVSVQDFGPINAPMGNNAGIVGFNGGGIVENCINYAAVTGYYTGAGIVAYNTEGTITKCTNYGNITARTGTAGSITGGIAGYADGSSLSLCHNAGTVTYVGTAGAGSVGGIVGVGDAPQNTIQNCYNSGTVSTNWNETCGGIIGSASSVDITGCYNSGTVSNSANAAKCGAIGGSVGTGSFIANSYYLDVSCGQGYAASSSVEPENANITAKTAEELNDADFLNILNQSNPVWGIANGVDYPVFLFTIPADYTAVDKALLKIPSDMGIYTDATVKSVNDAVNAVIRGKFADEQATVTKYATAIGEAIAGLIYKDADYSAVDRAIAKANALNKGDYNDFSAVEAAVNAVVRNKNITEQDEVNNMENAIEKAIAGLIYKDADYSAVDNAIAKANSLNKGNYTDFSAVEAAVNAVVRNKNITEQDEVNNMKNAIEKAIAGLIYKDADYSGVDDAIAKANSLNKGDYTDFSAVEAAVNAVVRNKNITEQDEVNNMARAIEDAINRLVKKTTPTSSPQTGDTSKLTFWFVLFILSSAGLTGTVLYNNNKKRKTN
ncbi:hypothetical protein [Diplocloster agilis]|uniref:Uncharacterized protein n=1 Tax=Diplocloster agilis TaxID=2850323 RepID=A0A949JY46_9FIRM|nr:hypothetical protein [Diplocloster agilis]MBU9736224.1 hypothetical protein [Diplocloster agilis]